MEPKFIKLHDRLTGGEIYINPSHIITLETMTNGTTWTTILCSGIKVEVRETDKEILSIIRK